MKRAGKVQTFWPARLFGPIFDLPSGTMENEIVNRVASSPLLQVDLEDWYDPAPRAVLDLAGFLHEGLILREKEFRQALNDFDWNTLEGTYTAVFCSADAIVPTWAFMLAVTRAQPFARRVFACRPGEIDGLLYEEKIRSLDPEVYRGRKVIVKGCSRYPVPLSAYISLAAFLRPLVNSLMYGEPCSQVPLFKEKKPLNPE